MSIVNVHSRNTYAQMSFLPGFPGAVLLNLIEGETFPLRKLLHKRANICTNAKQ